MSLTRVGSAAGLALGWLADQRLGDPRRGHPVAGFGALALRLEERLYGDDKLRGAVFEATLVGAAVGLGALLERALKGHPALRPLVVAAATWTVLGGRSLAREAEAIATANLIADILDAPGDEAVLARVKTEVAALARRFPVYG